jgi:hypothetical protein
LQIGYITLSLPCGEQKRQNAAPHEVLGNHRPTISAKPVGVGAASQRLIPTSKQSGLLMRIATENGSLCADELLTAFLELQRVTREPLCFQNVDWFGTILAMQSFARLSLGEPGNRLQVAI